MGDMKIFFDIECYQNYFLVMFRSEKGTVKAYEMYDGHPLDVDGITKLVTD